MRLIPPLVLLALALIAAPARAAPPTTVVLQGVVRDQNSGEPIAGALVVVQCACLQGAVEATTDAAGLYNLRNLPPGNYTVQVLAGQTMFTEALSAAPGVSRLDFKVDAASGRIVTDITVEQPVRRDTASGLNLKPEQLRGAGTGGMDRNFTGVVDVASTVTSDAGGLRIAGTTSAESKYTLDNANITTPAFGSLSSTVVSEFIDEVNVLEAGYDAEYGGATGGQIRARRIGGSNKLRGVVVMRVAPRLAAPRLIAATDEALRVAEIAELDAQAVVQISGPIVRDKLFFSVGVAPGGQRNSMIQSFHRRRDKDRDGGYEGCAYENGTSDCAANGSYIDTVKFAEQKFRTGRVDIQASGTLDWQITPKHRLRLSGGTSPISFRRTSFRLPPGAEPSAFGTNPSQTLGGQSRVGQGVINDTFGTRYVGITGVGLDYEGRVNSDKLEIDATVFYTRFRSVDAWRLNDPNLKNTPLLQQTDTQGQNLYDLLDRDGATRLVPGVDGACNNSNLPGLTCPTRTWLSGGVGNYSSYTQDRGGGLIALTHFLTTRRGGSHQIKYGAELDNVRFRQNTAYSGSNPADFYTNCPAGQQGGGEYCYDPVRDSYTTNAGNGRVDNHRSVTVDGDNPDIRTTIGYGRVRAEQNDLRAIATPIGAGVRVPSYDATLTTQNYGVFLQDRWAILSNLYISAGARWELQDMRDLLGRRNVFIWDNVAPPPRHHLRLDRRGQEPPLRQLRVVLQPAARAPQQPRLRRPRQHHPHLPQLRLQHPDHRRRAAQRRRRRADPALRRRQPEHHGSQRRRRGPAPARHVHPAIPGRLRAGGFGGPRGRRQLAASGPRPRGRGHLDQRRPQLPDRQPRRVGLGRRHRPSGADLPRPAAALRRRRARRPRARRPGPRGPALQLPRRRV
jgi:hypothetical protein